MTKLSLSVFALLFGVNSMAFLPGFNDTAPKPRASNGTGDCANFDGVWKGNCDSGNKETTVTILQSGCSFFHINQASPLQDFRAGGDSVIIETSPSDSGAWVKQTTVGTGWNADKSVLKLSVNAVSRGVQSGGAYSEPNVKSESGEFKLDGGKLVITATNEKGEAKTCTLTK